MLSNFNEQIVRNRPLCTLFLKVDLRYTCATLLCVLGVAGRLLDFHFSCVYVRHVHRRMELFVSINFNQQVELG